VEQATVPLRPDDDHGDDDVQAVLIRIGGGERPYRPRRLMVPLGDVSEVILGRGDEERLEPPAGRGRARTARVYLADSAMSTNHARLICVVGAGGRTYGLADLESTNGSLVNGVRIEAPRTLGHGDLIETGQTFWKLWLRPVGQLDRVLKLAYDGGPIRYPSSFSFDVLEAQLKLDAIAPTDLPVIIRGETGTGKEGMAEEVHRRSGRSGRLVALNCAAVPEGLMESELFGHRKGAFSGAVADKAGLVEEADGGTLLLDEVGDMPLALQAKLLRVLQEGSFLRLGDPRVRQANVRFVAATHRDLPRMVKEGSFRGDLYARLNGLTLNLPPLRERREDLCILLSALLLRQGVDLERLTVSHEALRALLLHDWPFNVRELEQALAVAMAFARDGERLKLSHLPEEVQRALEHGDSDGEAVEARRPARRRGGPPSRDELVRALEQHGGNVSAVARELETTRMQVHRWAKRHDIDLDSFRE